MNSALLLAVMSMLAIVAQPERCVLESDLKFNIGSRLTSTEMKTYHTYTDLQCYDKCIRHQKCKAFMFELKSGEAGNKMTCTLMLANIDNSTLPCNDNTCFISKKIDRKTPINYC